MGMGEGMWEGTEEEREKEWQVGLGRKGGGDDGWGREERGEGMTE